MPQSYGAWRATYSPGSWVVLSGPSSLVVLPPAPPGLSSRLNDLWDDVVECASIDQLVAHLTSIGLGSMPNLGVFFWDADGLHSLLRGSVEAIDLATGRVAASGENAITWRESGLESRLVRVNLETVDQSQVLQLPLVVGAVTASALIIDATGAIDPQFAPARLPRGTDTVEQGASDVVDAPQPIVAKQHVDESVPQSSAASQSAGVRPGQDDDHEPAGPNVPVESEQVESEQVESEQVEAEQVEAAHTEPEQVEPEQVESEQAEPERVEAAHTEPEQVEPEQAEPEQAEPEQAEPEQVEAAHTEPEPAGHDAAPQPEPDGAPPAAVAVPAPHISSPWPASAMPLPMDAPPPEFQQAEFQQAEFQQAEFQQAEFQNVGVQQPEPHEPMAQQPHDSMPRHDVPAPPQDPRPWHKMESAAEPADEQRSRWAEQSHSDEHDGQTVFFTNLAATHKPSAPAAGQTGQVLAALCPNGHANAPGAQHCRICFGPVDSARPQLVNRPVLGILRTSTGDSVEIRGPILVGRAPSASGHDPDADLVRVPSPSQDISRTHVLVAPNGWSVEITDLNSTNGTMVRHPGQEPVKLPKGEAVSVAPGTVIDLGDGVTLEVSQR